MKTDPYYQRPMTPVSGNRKYTRSGLSCLGRQFLAILVATSSETLQIRRKYYKGYVTPCQPVIDCKMDDLEMTLSGNFMSKSAGGEGNAEGYQSVKISQLVSF